MLIRWFNILFISTLVYGFVLIECCFEYSGTLRNPCTEDKCPFGAECIPSFDGRSFECSCPKCASYGDSRDSRPICGSDGRDYSSLCELNRRSCSLSRSVSVRYNGSCDPCHGVKCPDSQICTIDDNRNPICKCNAACETDYVPVCGSDGRNYVNECVLRVEACKTRKSLRILHQGTCSDANACKTIKCSNAYQECETNRYGIAVCQCPSTCSKVLKPVCGTDSETYDSLCELRRQSCNSHRNVSVRYYGACDPDSYCHQNHGVCKFGSICYASGENHTCVCDECSEDYAPVCGSNQISYSNFCKFRQHMCEMQTTNVTVRQGPCDGCAKEICLFYSHCKWDYRTNQAKCVCPSNCPKVYEPVCGSDLVTYPNECELKSTACERRKYVSVIKRGPCSSCQGVRCDYGARCENGVCVCPAKCPTDSIEPVCGSNNISYDNLCQLMQASCESTTQITVKSNGPCEDSLQTKGSNLYGQVCLVNTCKYGGICVYDRRQNMNCICNFNCSATSGMNTGQRICGNDGRIYASECDIREEMCNRQQEIKLMEKIFCEKYRNIPCEGEPSLVDPSTRKEYNCTEQRCPDNSFCHRGPNFAKCCRDSDPDDDCYDSTFGCCPDGKSPSLGPNYAGCPSKCQCNRLGSYLLRCDPLTNKCYCKPGVGGVRCDRCEAGFWGLHKISEGNAGCIPCNCNKIGSSRDDCEQMSGRCVCKSGFKGMKCDICPDGSPIEFGGCARAENMTCSDDSHCKFGAICKDYICHCNLDCRDSPKSPVCSNDGIVFDSECYMQLWSCKAQKTMTIQHSERCRLAMKNSATTSPIVRRSTEYQNYEKSTAKTNMERETISSTQPTMPTIQWNIQMERFIHFGGDSYIELATLQAYSKVSIQIELVPFETDGVIFFNAQTLSGEGDYIALLLKNSYVEFRFNLGSGSVVLRSKQPITLGQKTLINLRRHLSEGFLSIDNLANVTAKSEGPYKLLDLSHNLIIGGYGPNVDLKRIVDILGMKQNFTGCIHSMQVNDEEVDLALDTSKEILRKWKVEPCSQQKCSQTYCNSGGKCLQNNHLNVCLCEAHRTGTRCQHVMQHCIDGDCNDQPSVTLDFWEESYIELPTLQGVSQSFVIEVWLMARSPNGIVLYNGQSKGDFVELAIVDGYVQYSFNLGGQNNKNGIVSIKSDSKLRLGHWHRVIISRKVKNGTLQIDDELSVEAIAKGNLNELNLDEPFYIGGLGTSKRWNNQMISGFNGAIQRISLNGQLMRDNQSRASKLVNIQPYNGPPCDSSNLCTNHGTCVPWLDSFLCKCQTGYHGNECEFDNDDSRWSIKPSMVNDGALIEFTSNNFPGLNQQQNMIEMTLRIKSSNGLVLWISKDTETISDYMAIVLSNGYLEFAFNLGKQTQYFSIRSPIRIDDGNIHHIVANRNKQIGIVQVDNKWMNSSVSEPGSTDLNTDGKLWFGVRKVECDMKMEHCLKTGQRMNIPPGLPASYYAQLNGCLHSVRIQGMAVDLSTLGNDLANC